MDSLLYQLKCCFGPYGFSCCLISPVRQSKATRMMYSLMLIIVSILCTFLHERTLIEKAFSKLGTRFNQTCIVLSAEENCGRFLGYKSIYRVAYSFSAFHILMTIFCWRISSSNGWRAKLHNGFWLFKVAIVMCFWTALFMFPQVERFITVATIIGIGAAVIFIVLQDVSMIDCAYEFNEYLRQKSSKNCCYDKLLYIISAALYLITVAGYVFLYLGFALQKPCVKIRVIIIVNASASLIVILFSFFIKQYQRCKLFVPGGVTCVLVVFLTWTAISSAPYEMIAANYTPQTPREAKMIKLLNSKNNIFECRAGWSRINNFKMGPEIDTFIGISIMLATAVYACVKSTIEFQRYGIKPAKSKAFSISQLQKGPNDVELRDMKTKSKNRISMSHLTQKVDDQDVQLHKAVSMPSIVIISKRKESIVEDLKNCPIDAFTIHDEFNCVQYSYSWMHFNFSLAYLFVMVQLTNWYSPETSHIFNFDKSWPSVWLKITTSWIALFLFSWTLLCPAFCIGRRLYEYPFDSMNRYRKENKSKKAISK